MYNFYQCVLFQHSVPTDLATITQCKFAKFVKKTRIIIVFLVYEVIGILPRLKGEPLLASTTVTHRKGQVKQMHAHSLF